MTSSPATATAASSSPLPTHHQRRPAAGRPAPQAADTSIRFWMEPLMRGNYTLDLLYLINGLVFALCLFIRISRLPEALQYDSSLMSIARELGPSFLLSAFAFLGWAHCLVMRRVRRESQRKLDATNGGYGADAVPLTTLTTPRRPPGTYSGTSAADAGAGAGAGAATRAATRAATGAGAASGATPRALTTATPAAATTTPSTAAATSAPVASSAPAATSVPAATTAPAANAATRTAATTAPFATAPPSGQFASFAFRPPTAAPPVDRTYHQQAYSSDQLHQHVQALQGFASEHERRQQQERRQQYPPNSFHHF